MARNAVYTYVPDKASVIKALAERRDEVLEAKSMAELRVRTCITEFSWTRFGVDTD